MHGVTSRNRGFSIIELLIATAIGLAAISGVITCVMGFQSTLTDGELNMEMATAAAALIEQSRAEARQDFNLVNPTSTVIGNYAGNIAVDVGADHVSKMVTAIVSYTIGGRTLSTTLATILTNMENTRAADTCDSVPTGDWTHPQVMSVALNSFIGSSGTTSIFSMSDLDAYKDRLYVSIESATYRTDPTFFVFDVSDPSNPTLLSAVDNNSAVLSGLAGVRVAEDFIAHKVYAFAANKGASQLQIFDVTSGTPVLVKTFRIFTASGQGNSIFYRDGYIYEGLTTASGDEFNIIDVGAVSPASPTNPIWRSSYPVGNGVNAISVKDDRAYIVSPNAQNLLILNVASAYSPYYVGGYTPPHAPGSEGIGSDHGESVFPVGTTVYLGRTYGSREFYDLDASTPSSVMVNGNKDVSIGNQSSVYDIHVRDTLAFLATKAKFDILDISHPQAMYSIASTTLPGSGAAFDCEGNTFFVASNQSGNGYLSVFTPDT